MTLCKTLVMSCGAVRLTTMRATISGAPAKSDELVRELARTKVEAAEALRREVAQVQVKQRERCRQCEVQLDACMQSMRDEIETRVVEMGLKLAEIVLRHQLPDRVMLENLMRETLRPVSDLRGIRIRVSPAEAQAQAAKGAVESEWPGPALSGQVEFAADPALSDGDLVIESRSGIFDGRLQERLALLSEKLEERLRHTHAIPNSKSS